MKVLVTGGAGYIGSHACKALAVAGHQPIVFDNLRTGHREAVKWGPFEHGDLLDPRGLWNVMNRHRPDAVMHFAALGYVGESVLQPEDYYRTNVVGSLNLIDAMRQVGVGRLVFSSTCSVYGLATRERIAETDPKSPINPYGRTKLTVEHMIEDHCSLGGIGAVVLRYFNAAGADPDGDIGENHDPETHLIPLVLQAAAGQRPSITVYGRDFDTPDGTCVRDYLHVSDIAQAHVAALESIKTSKVEAFNLGTGSGSSVAQIVETVRRVTGRDFPALDGPRRPGDPPTLVADPSKANAVLGWKPRLAEIETMIETAWRWTLKNV